MARPPILYLAPDGLHCHSQHKRTNEHDGHFIPDAAGLEAFSHWLSRFRTGTPFTLLVDLPDERFKIEALPHVRGPDRKRLRERRQAQIFPDTPYVAHQYLDREESGRRDERLLFVALNRPSAIASWLATIERQGHRLTRLIPMPFLAATVIPDLPAASGPFLLALRTPAGLRVSCFEGHKLLLSRLHSPPSDLPTPLSDGQTEAWEAYRQLLSQRLIAHNTQCTCYLLTLSPNDAVPTQEPSTSHGDLQFMRLNPTHLIKGTSQTASSDDNCLPLLLHRLGTRPRLPQAMPDELLLSHQLHRLGLTLQATATVILGTCITLAIVNMREIQPLEQRSAAAQTRGDDTERSLAALLASKPAPPYPLARLQVTLDLLQHLHAASPGPEQALRQLAVALSPIPGIALRRIDWSTDSHADVTKAAAKPAQILTLHFALPHEGARERAAHAQRILAALGTLPDAQLHTEQIPLELMANRSLSPAVLGTDTQTSGLVVRMELPVAKP